MKKLIYFFVVLVVLTALLWAAVSIGTSNHKTDNTMAKTPTPALELKTETLKEGTGRAAKAGDILTVNYTGTLEDGTKFDSSYDRNTPFTFRLGAGSVIRGWDYGLVGMKVGELRRLTIAPTLGYGFRDNGPIPAGSTLIFEVELIKIQ